MRTLTVAELLHIWEYGQDRALLQKSLTMLAAACPPADFNLAAHWPIGTRDALLIQFREQFFGGQLQNTAVCPACSEQLEWEMKTKELLLQKPVEWPEIPVFSTQIEAFSIRFRLPHSADFINGFPREPYSLVRNCILSVQKDDKSILAEAVPAPVLAALESDMVTKDPNANLVFNLKCPACQHEFRADFDITTYLWKEVDNWAKRILQEVFILARTLGWAEQDILSMSPKRRQFYLEMLRT